MSVLIDHPQHEPTKYTAILNIIVRGAVATCSAPLTISRLLVRDRSCPAQRAKQHCHRHPFHPCLTDTHGDCSRQPPHEHVNHTARNASLFRETDATVSHNVRNCAAPSPLGGVLNIEIADGAPPHENINHTACKASLLAGVLPKKLATLPASRMFV